MTPAELLAPPGAAKPATDNAAVRAVANLATRIEQLIASGADPEGRESLSGYVDRALRRVHIEIEELLEETPIPEAS